MRFVLLIAVLAACKDASEPTTPATPKPTVTQLLDQTDQGLALAADAVRKGGYGQEQYRGAAMRQLGAREALGKDKPALAAKFSIQARKHASKALTLNGGVADPALFQATPAEKELKVGADDTEHSQWMERLEKSTPSAAELLGGDPDDLTDRTREVVERTDAVVEMARAAVAADGGKERAKFRNVWVRQEAGRRALADGRFRVAAKFSLIARRHAGQILEANGGKIPDGLVQTPEEKAIKTPVENTPDSEVDPLLAAVEKTCPPLEKLLEAPK